MEISGPRLIIAFAPCPTGWYFDPKETVEIGKLAVKTGIWPLKEYVDGKVTHTLIPRQRSPVEDNLRRQGRFSHLFAPQRNEAILLEIQEQADAYWEGIG
jgi:pyruvate ferredoxin oxidoreductase beta subunit